MARARYQCRKKLLDADVVLTTSEANGRSAPSTIARSATGDTGRRLSPEKMQEKITESLDIRLQRRNNMQGIGNSKKTSYKLHQALSFNFSA